MITDNPKFKLARHDFFEMGTPRTHSRRFTMDLELYEEGAKTAESIIAADTMAIEFAEWLQFDGWSKSGLNGSWYRPKLLESGTMDAEYSTLPELLEIFKQQRG